MVKPGWKKELIEKYKHMLPTDGQRWPVVMFGIEHGDGWRVIVEGLFEHIDNLIKEHGAPPVVVHQVKEKFGELCFYYDGGDDAVHEAVRDAEHAAHYTCELCGTTENVGRTQGWILTCCKNCHETCSNENVRARVWKPIIKEDETTGDK